jgi:hypothetical protein
MFCMFDERVRGEMREIHHDDREQIPFWHEGCRQIEGLPSFHFNDPVDEALIVTEDMDSKLARTGKTKGFKQDHDGKEESSHCVRFRSIQSGIRPGGGALNCQDSTDSTRCNGSIAPSARFSTTVTDES